MNTPYKDLEISSRISSGSAIVHLKALWVEDLKPMVSFAILIRFSLFILLIILNSFIFLQ